MHPLRVKFERELKIRGRSERTIHAYVAGLRALTRHDQNRSPEKIGDEEIRDWLHHLKVARRLSGSSLNVAVNAVRAFHTLVLGREPAAAIRGVPHCKRATTRAEVYALTEMTALLAAAPEGRDRAFLSTVYAGGLRLDEARHLQIKDLDVPRAIHELAGGPADIAGEPKGAHRKIEIARCLRRADAVPHRWTTRQLNRGTPDAVHGKVARCS